MKHRASIPAEELSKMLFEFSYVEEMNGVPFKPRAYQLASESITALGDEVEAAWRRGGIKALKELPSVGESIATKIDEYFKTGRVREYDALKKRFPVDIWGLSRIEGLGARHIRDLYKRLKVKDVEDLRRALAKHEVKGIPRWGEKSEAKLAKGLGLLERSTGRHLLSTVLPIADMIVAALSKAPGVKRCTYAGSLRRMQETVGDIDLIATGDKPERIMDVFINLPSVETVLERGTTRSSVRLRSGIDADLRVVPDKVYGATLQYFTGDKKHNVMLREYALSQGYTLSEYGLFKKRANGKSHAAAPVVCKTEDEIYARLGLDTPPPELRQGNDEIDAAREHRLPDLLPYGSVQGDLQVQSNWTDGAASIEDMAMAAKRQGLSYLAITDHTQALAFVGGLKDADVLRQGQEIDALNNKLRGFTVLKGTECDILKDGTLDLKDETLSRLDWVGISVHSAFTLPRTEQTRRVIKALANPNVDCLFHPTGRLIGKRDPIDVDMDEIIAAAKKHNVALEINAYPDRLDLRDTHVRAAVRAGVKLVIDSDAHSPDHFQCLRFGEAMARRGWATKEDILNTRPLKEFINYKNKKSLGLRHKTEAMTTEAMT